MKKLRLVCMSIIGLAAVSCYDDSKVWETMEDYEARLAELETLCSTMNTNISSLQTLVGAVKASDYITKVEPLTENDKEVGYTITFAKLGTVKIYHGKDGKDGVDGQNGAMPTLKIEDDYWYVSYDGRTWTRLDKCRSENGKSSVLYRAFAIQSY